MVGISPQVAFNVPTVDWAAGRVSCQ